MNERSQEAIWSERTDLVELAAIEFGREFKAIDGETYRKTRFIKDNPNLGVVVERSRDNALNYFCSIAKVEPVNA